MGSKITQLTEATAPSSGDDLVEIVINTATTPASRKMKFLNLLKRLFLGDGTQLTITTIADGEFLKRSGTNITSGVPSGTTDTEAVQDIVGALFIDNSDLDLTYDDGAGTVVATIKPGAAPLSPVTVTLTDAATITWATGGARQNNAKVTLGGNRTLDITGEVDGATGLLIVKQDGSGGRSLTLPGSSLVINDGGGAVTLSTGPNDVDILTWYYDGTNFFWTIGVNYS